MVEMGTALAQVGVGTGLETGMRLRSLWTAAAALILGTMPGTLHAQQFNIGSVPVQVHGFVAQGFAKSDENNFLTMDTSGGSGAMTDGAVNASSQLTPKVRVGAQLYARRIGELGH